MIAGLPVNQLAQGSPLDPSRFAIEHDVPIFDEHEVEEPVYGPDGKVSEIRTVKYSKAVLESMCENMNKRIEDTGDYTAICAGHTPTPSERRAGLEQPDLVGFCGPFYVGTIGTVDPRPAIIAKNWAIFHDEVDRCRKLPRRSVEVWREENPKDRYIEPIALLGAETPRRDLGLAYSLRHKGVPVERYTASAPCYPSGTNTFVPGSKKDKTHYDQQESTGMALTDDDINKIVAAVMELDFAKWAMGQMEQGQAKAPPTDPMAAAGGAPGAPPAGAPPEQAGMPESGADPAMGGAGAPPEMNGDAEEPAGNPMGSGDDEDPEAVPKDRSESPEDGLPPAMGGEAPSGDGPQFGDSPDGDEDEDEDEPKTKNAKGENMNDLKTRYAQMEQYNKKLAERLQAIENRATQAERYAEIKEWQATYLLDEAEEVERAARYSADQWDEHKKIVARYERNPVGFLPIPNTIKPKQTGKDEKVFYNRVSQLGDQYLRVGKYKKYDELEAEVRKEMNGAAH